MKEVTQAQLVEKLREMAEKSSQREVALQLGIRPAMMNDLLRGRRDISERVAAAIGFERVIVFRKVA